MTLSLPFVDFILFKRHKTFSVFLYRVVETVEVRVNEVCCGYKSRRLKNSGIWNSSMSSLFMSLIVNRQL